MPNRMKTNRGQARYIFLLDTGFAILSEDDDVPFNTRQVTKQANLSLGALYHYFDSFEAYALALQARTWH